ncbi:MAG: hypothetical protein QOJ17_1399 [Rhodospirillaceae bacterium]|jgi:hypothetical protein|nr:hypothetical protein [Rhodospirillaceae bacterium]
MVTLSAADRAELCGLDMPLRRQLRNKSLWLAFDKLLRSGAEAEYARSMGARNPASIPAFPSTQPETL